MGASLANIFRLGVKELRSLRSDPVLLILIIYSFTFAIYTVATGINYEVKDAAVAIVDEDRTELSRSIQHALLEPYFKAPAAIGANEIDAAMDADRFVFAVDIPPKFESDVLARRPTSVQINVDATAMSQAGNGAVYLQNIITQQVLDYIQNREGRSPALVSFVVRSKFNPNLNSAWFTSVMEVINNITVLSVILTGAALIREREHGTIEHLLVMPVTPVEIMAAKIWASGSVILFTAMLSLLLVIERVLGVPIAGSMTLFLCGAALYQFSVTALGILLATFSNSMPQFGLLLIPVTVIMELLSGSTTPMESMPEWLQTIMYASPSTRFVDFAQAILYRGSGFDIVWPDLLALAGIGAVFFGISLLRFRTAITRYQSG